MKRLLVACCVTLLPSLAWAQIDNSAVQCSTSDPTYFPRGDHWPMTPPASSNPILFNQQADGAPGISGDAELVAVRDAFATWMGHRCAGGAAPNVLIRDAHDLGGAYYPTRDRGDVYDEDGGLVSVENIIYFVVQDWEETLADSLTVALSTNLYIPDTGHLVTSDMEFNAVNFQWRAGGAGCSGGQQCFDVESVALHEAGHFLGLNHVTCANAVMFPQGSGTATRTELSMHEEAAICAVYPPRPSSVATARYTGEQCSSTDQCPTSPTHVCVKPAGVEASSPWGICAQSCTSTSDCPTAFVCASQDGGTRFCKPGVHNTGGAVDGSNGGVPVTDPTGESRDLCLPCTKGADCASGVCISSSSDATSGLCTQMCVSGTLPDGTTTNGSCPEGMLCTPTDQEWSVCWPENGISCASGDTYRADLNELCYDQGSPSNASDDAFQACKPGLICFGFKARCSGQQGACMLYCNASDTPCPDSSLKCCSGVDEHGNCLPTTSTKPHGGCFDLRAVGESCVVPEQSICEQGAGCFNFGDANLSKCYRMCESSACGESEGCMTYTEQCEGSSASLLSICCDTAKLGDPVQPAQCYPSDPVQLYDLGVACRESSECASSLCLTYRDHSSCSRPCNLATEVGCPGDVDVNGDGINDGGFRCVSIGDEVEGRCWPLLGPAEPPAKAAEETPVESGCCSAAGATPGTLLLNLVVWLPLFRRRRRQF